MELYLVSRPLEDKKTTFTRSFGLVSANAMLFLHHTDALTCHLSHREKRLLHVCMWTEEVGDQPGPGALDLLSSTFQRLNFFLTCFCWVNFYLTFCGAATPGQIPVHVVHLANKEILILLWLAWKGSWENYLTGLHIKKGQKYVNLQD